MFNESQTPLNNPKPILSAWQIELRDSYTSLEELEKAGFLVKKNLENIVQKSQIRITPYYASLIEKNLELQENCPIYKQAIPDFSEEDPLLPEWAKELSQRAFQNPTPWRADAIGDLERLKAPRLTHRYGNRALLHVSPVCAMYCRFCFRKSHLNDQDRTLYSGDYSEALEYISQTPEITEVILTGGDPLSLHDLALKKLIDKLEAIPHLKVCRIHTRMPVTLPSRITENLVSILKNRKISIFFVTHFNHPKELTNVSKNHTQVLIQNGIPVLNQTVLLKGINDESKTLACLFNELYTWGVIPYYLHHADWTPGTFNFRTSIERGIELANSLKGKLSGPACPDYVLDLPGGMGKVSLQNAQHKLLEKKEDQNLGAALWEFQTPQTKLMSEKVLYTEIWKK